MNYQESLQYIKECTKYGTKLGLERIGEILKRLDNPQTKFQAIHIAGTNGKGSTTAMFDAVFREAGYKTGRYTSPHLVTYRERFSVNDEPISKDNLAQIVTKMQPVLASVIEDGLGNPTEFEVGTVLAFEYFANQKVDIGLIEVGMGGRFDATNMLKPILSVITHIALDHQEFLGTTLEEIAFEKAGIIKPGIPVIIGVQKPEIETYLLNIARERRSPVKLVSSIKSKVLKYSETGTEYTITNIIKQPLTIKLGLIGRHQVLNSLNVLAGLELLFQSGLNIKLETLLGGLAKSKWPGRMERIELDSSRILYLDGAHNPDGAKALLETIQTVYPGQKVDLLVGILNNRPLKEIAAILAGITRQVIVTTVPDPKSAAVDDLAAVFNELGIQVIKELNPEKALERLKTTDNPLKVATGSLYLIGYLRALLFNIGD